MTMRRIETILATCSLALMTLVGGAGCRSFDLEPPAGFAEVNAGKYGARMKAGDDVGLNLAVFDNVDGGTLQFWSVDLVKKLARRGYTLEGQQPARSKNGVMGTRFDFSYQPPGTEAHKFYSVVLFVSDANVVALQLAGEAALRSTYMSKVDGIASDTVVRGCRSWTRVCDGPQPDKLTAPASAPAAAAGDTTELASDDKPAAGS